LSARSTGQGSGVPVEMVVGALWTVEDAQVGRAENSFEFDDAAEAARLSQ
jgi:outer membrane biosynthesis protein TonB